MVNSQIYYGTSDFIIGPVDLNLFHQCVLKYNYKPFKFDTDRSLHGSGLNVVWFTEKVVL